MTVQVNGVDLANIIEIAAWVGSIVAMLIIGLLVYLMVRPPRRRRDAPPVEADALDVRELVRLLDRMEQRLEVLERAVAAEAKDEDRFLETGARAPDRRNEQ